MNDTRLADIGLGDYGNCTSVCWNFNNDCYCKGLSKTDDKQVEKSPKRDKENKNE